MSTLLMKTASTRPLFVFPAFPRTRGPRDIKEWDDAINCRFPAHAGTQTGSAGVPACIIAPAKGRHYFHALWWRRQPAWAIPLKIAPGAAWHTRIVTPAHHPSSPRSLSPTPIGERGPRLGARASPPASSLPPRSPPFLSSVVSVATGMANSYENSLHRPLFVFPAQSLPRTPIRGGNPRPRPWIPAQGRNDEGLPPFSSSYVAFARP